MKFMQHLPDVQKQTEGFPPIFIEKVGVENIKVELPVQEKGQKLQKVTASMQAFCSLDAWHKGINMSRMGQVIFQVIAKNNGQGFSDLDPFIRALQAAHEAQTVSLSAGFDYFLYQKTPITHLETTEPFHVEWKTCIEAGKTHHYLTLRAFAMSLCPCSKEMSLLKNVLTPEEFAELETLSPALQKKILASGFGAHNQKSEIVVTVECMEGHKIGMVPLYDKIMQSVSAPTYSILKRPDEKWVTEVSYMGGYWEQGKFHAVGGGPKFVEDIARSLAEKLQLILDQQIADYRIYVKNHESIHSEGIAASAMMTAGRRLTSLL